MRAKRNRIAALCLTVCMLFALTLQANAAVMMEYIVDSDCVLEIENSVATIDAFVTGYSSLATECEIEVVLQEKGLFRWSEYETWYDSQDGRRAEIHESIDVNSGKSYRAVVTVTVWSGDEYETQEYTTDSVKA